MKVKKWTGKEKISLKQCIRILNSAVKADRIAIGILIKSRMLCNKKLAKHPTIQVSRTKDNFYQVGILGILNGIFGVDKNTFGGISAIFNNKGKFQKFAMTNTDKVTKHLNKKLEK